MPVISSDLKPVKLTKADLHPAVRAHLSRIGSKGGRVASPRNQAKWAKLTSEWGRRAATIRWQREAARRAAEAEERAAKMATGKQAMSSWTHHKQG